LHVVAIGCLVCPNVCSTAFTWDAVYATVSGLGIVFSLSMCVFYVFLKSNVDSLGAIVSMQPADLLEFQYCYGSKAVMLVGFYCVPVTCFSGQGLLHILMTTTKFLLTSNTYGIKKS